MEKILDVNCGIGDAIPYTTVVEHFGVEGYKSIIRQNPLHNNIKFIGQGAVLFKNNRYVTGEVIRTDEKIHPQPKFIHGHIIEDVCYNFGISPVRKLKGYLYCSEEEIEWANEQLSKSSYIVALHAGGSTFPSQGTYCARNLWVNLAQFFEQCGLDVMLLPNGFHKSYEPKDIPCKYNFSDLQDVRKLIALLHNHKILSFVGNDSGPVHIARCFNIPSVVTWSIPHKVEVAAFNQWNAWHKDPNVICGELVSSISSFARYSYPDNMNILIWNENDERVFDMITGKVKANGLC